MSKLSESLYIEKSLYDPPLLIESFTKVDKRDKSFLLDIIKNFKETQYNLYTYTGSSHITTKTSGKLMFMEYPADFIELTQFIIDVCDELGYTVQTEWKDELMVLVIRYE